MVPFGPMATKKQNQRKKSGRHVRFPSDLDKWLEKQAESMGLKSAPALVVSIVHQYRTRLERGEGKAA